MAFRLQSDNSLDLEMLFLLYIILKFVLKPLIISAYFGNLSDLRCLAMVC